MTPAELKEEVAIEVEAIETVLAELDSLRRDVAEPGPTARDLAAAGLFLANFYNGIENILKRICRYQRVEVPSGGDLPAHRSVCSVIAVLPSRPCE
jgi:hypothetical protein